MKQLEIGLRKTQKAIASCQRTRRSTIAREQNPPAINEPNIDDILALELSDTLINAAYNLAVTRIVLAVHKLCDPTEAIFVRCKFGAFENLRIYANRVRLGNVANDGQKESEELVKSRQSILTHVGMFKKESLIKERSGNDVILTKQLQKQKILNTIKKILQRMSKIIKTKLLKSTQTAFLTLQTHNNKKSPTKPPAKTSIQQTFQKYQQTRINQRHFHRRSIDKQPQRKSSNQLIYSLNKPYEQQLSRLKSSQRNQGNSKNLLYIYTGNNNTDKKASTCSQTQSNNSQKESQSLPQKYQHPHTTKAVHGTSVLNKFKVTTPSKILNHNGGVGNIQDSRVASLLMNGSYFAEGTKERELEILRKKYYRLVEEFRDFSERFLQVIKEE